MLRLPLTIIAAMLLVTTGASIAVAQTGGCGNAASTAEINRCFDLAYQAADTKLNKAYQEALAAIKKSGGEKPYDAASWEKALRASQNAWIAFRDADCSGLTPMSWGGGTGGTAAVLECMRAKTEARTKELTAVGN